MDVAPAGQGIRRHAHVSHDVPHHDQVRLRNGHAADCRPRPVPRLGEDGLYLLQRVGVQLEVPRRRVGPDVTRVAAPRDGRRHALLLDDPPEGQRGQLRAEPLGDRAQPLHLLEVLPSLSRGEESRIGPHSHGAAPPVLLVECGVFLDGTGEQAEREWAVSQVSHALFVQPWQEATPVILMKERELVLYRIDMPDRQTPLDEGPIEVADADVRGQAFILNLGHGAPGLFDGNGQVGPVQLVKVHVIDAHS